jgi:hypothetical protein
VRVGAIKISTHIQQNQAYDFINWPAFFVFRLVMSLHRRAQVKFEQGKYTLEYSSGLLLRIWLVFVRLEGSMSIPQTFVAWAVHFHSQDHFNVLYTYSCLLRLGQQSSSLDDILNLPSVQSHFSQSLNVSFVELAGFCLIRQKSFPDMESTLGIKRRVVDRKVDARLKSGIKCGNSIRCQEHHTAVVLELLQKDLGRRVLSFEASDREPWAKNSLDTSLFRPISAVVRASRKISHSSRSRIAPHFVVSSSTRSSDLSTSAAVSPNSPALIEYSGWRISSATLNHQ